MVTTNEIDFIKYMKQVNAGGAIYGLQKDCS